MMLMSTNVMVAMTMVLLQVVLEVVMMVTMVKEGMAAMVERMVA